MKILFITATRLGDAILTTGILDHLCRQYPGAEVTVACGPLPVSLFEGFPCVKTIIPLKKKPRNGHWIDLWKQVISTRWDIVVDTRNSAVSRLVRAGNRFIAGHGTDKNAHKAEQAAKLLKLENVPPPVLYFTQEQTVFAERLVPQGSSVLAVGPTANWIGKTWPAENFMRVIEWMIAPGGIMPHSRVAIFAAPGEEEAARRVLESIPEDRRIDGIAKGTPGEAAAAIARCDFFIGNDSGLMHAAAAARVPTLGLFGPSYPHLYAPWGDHTAYVQTPQTFDELTDFDGYDAKTLDRTLMIDLTVEMVTRIIENFEPLHERLYEQAERAASA